MLLNRKPSPARRSRLGDCTYTVKAIFTLIFLLSSTIGLAQGITDAFGGWRDSLNNRGISPSIVYSAMPVANLNGGIKTGFRYIDNVDLTLNLDFEKLAQLKGLSVFLYGLLFR